MGGRLHEPRGYDLIADWYADYVTGAAANFSDRVRRALRWTLERGRGVCWDLACGTGIYADTIRDLGWTPVGTDISHGQLRHASTQLPVAVTDATRPAVRRGSVSAVVSVLCHTDIDDYAAVCRAAASALVPDGRFVHVGVHPCFCAVFVDRADPERLVTTPGYWDRGRRFEGPSNGVRVRAGAVHVPLSELVTAITAAGLIVESMAEFGEPTPDVLAIRARRPIA